MSHIISLSEFGGVTLADNVRLAAMSHHGRHNGVAIGELYALCGSEALAHVPTLAATMGETWPGAENDSEPEMPAAGDPSPEPMLMVVL